jgi:hypothetical protein
MVRSGTLKSSDDFYSAALVFQHSQTADDAKTAFALATIARQMPHPAEQDKNTDWLTAAALDRMLMRYKQPQWYGTQFIESADGKAWELYEFNRQIVTPEERQSLLLKPSSEVVTSFPRTQ